MQAQTMHILGNQGGRMGIPLEGCQFFYPKRQNRDWDGAFKLFNEWRVGSAAEPLWLDVLRHARLGVGDIKYYSKSKFVMA